MHRDMTGTDKLLVGKTFFWVAAATLLFTLQAIAVHAVQQRMDRDPMHDSFAVAHAGR